MSAPILPENIPQELKDRRQWVVWKLEAREGDGKLTKIPYQSARPGKKAEADNPRTWGTFAEAWERYQAGGFDGIGYVFSENDPYAGADFDDCIDAETGEISEWAAKWIKRLASYSEVSFSETGIHTIVKAFLPGGQGRKQPRGEIYDRKRYFAFTGQHRAGTPKKIKAQQSWAEKLAIELSPKPRPEGAVLKDTPPLELGDEEALEHHRGFENGPKFIRLFDQGDASDYLKSDGTPDHSRADSALAAMLRFLVGNDHARIKRLMEASALRRAKWDTMRSEQTWLELTITNVVEDFGHEDCYDPKGHEGARASNFGKVYDDETLKRVRVVKATLPDRINAAELMALELDPARYIVPGYLPTGLALLASRPKIGKSWLMLAAAVAVASGGKTLGMDVEQGDVLYLALEDSLRRLQDRLGQLIDESEERPKRLELWTRCPRLNEGGLNEILGWIDAHPQARMVVIDVLGKVAPPKSGAGDDYSHVTGSLGPLQEMALERDLAVVLVHHTKKPNKDGGDIFDQVLGSTALVSIADTIMVMQRERMEADAVLAVTGRDIEERQVALSLDEKRGLWTVVGNAETMRIPPAQRKVMEAIDAGHTTPGELAKHLKKGRTAVQNVLTKLLSKGLVATEAMGTYRLTTELKNRVKLVKTGDSSDSGDTGDSSDSSDTSASSAQVSPSVTKVSPPVGKNGDTSESSTRMGQSASRNGQESPVSPVSPIPPKTRDYFLQKVPHLADLIHRFDAGELDSNKAVYVEACFKALQDYSLDSPEGRAELDHLTRIAQALEAEASPA